MLVYTLGHSTLPLEAFLAVVRGAGIATVADVRRFPASRRHPHFARAPLGQALTGAGISYEWLAGLGGRRRGRPDSPHVAWRSAGFRAYADHMESAEFQADLARLLALARSAPTAVLCAEAVPWRCHRQLIADALVARGIDVHHLVAGRPPEPHRLTAFARIEGERVVYDGRQDTPAGAARGVASRAERLRP